MRPALPALLSLIAGYVDTVGFLALHGLFTTHVTGNFVTLGASLVLGTSGALAKLLALPLFCVVVTLVTLLGKLFARLRVHGLSAMLALELVLLIVSAVLSMQLAPFPDGDAPRALMMGGALVAAMAIQNAAQRIHMSALPPTTIMTGTTTQIMIDVGDLLHGGMTLEARALARGRLKRMSFAVVTFAVGCAFGAALYAWRPAMSFIAPAALAAAALALANPEARRAA